MSAGGRDPAARLSGGRVEGGSAARTGGYAELQVTSNFSFLRGASQPEELVERAHALGYRALALTDRNTLAGVVRAHHAVEPLVDAYESLYAEALGAAP